METEFECGRLLGDDVRMLINIAMDLAKLIFH